MDLLLHDIIEIEDIQSEKDVNKRLHQGWKLLETYTECYDPEAFYKHQYVHYVVGRPSAVSNIPIDNSLKHGTVV